MLIKFRALGEMALFPIIKLIEDWKYICLFIFILPLIILMIMSIWIVEPPEFFYVQKKYE